MYAEASHQAAEILGRSPPMLVPAGLFVMQQVRCPWRDELSLDPGLQTLDGVLLVPAGLFVMQQVRLWYES